MVERERAVAGRGRLDGDVPAARLHPCRVHRFPVSRAHDALQRALAGADDRGEGDGTDSGDVEWVNVSQVRLQPVRSCSTGRHLDEGRAMLAAGCSSS